MISPHRRADTDRNSAAQHQTMRFASTKEYRFPGTAEKEIALDSLVSAFSENIDCSPNGACEGNADDLH
ncbi:hypothetical protein AAFG13_34730 [Bradyrhizobium sp. B124]|uniref:hypothetical protein n=1 Tax=Bradyrhizobium sp. B124 TaxID=3140245 RepID=UPI003183D93B